MRRTGKQRGFTLIELLVVISIIGLLSSIVLASLTSARAKSRDARRLSDMRQFELALQLFFDDHGHYPGTPEGVPPSGEQIGTGGNIDAALSSYLASVSKDPLHDGTTYFYSYDPIHCVTGQPNGVVFGFNKAETSSNIRKDTRCGGDQNLNNADYNILLYPVAP